MSHQNIVRQAHGKSSKNPGSGGNYAAIKTELQHILKLNCHVISKKIEQD